ncbi:piggyBac transposable element-derived protein 4-like [Pecten maximus]|uniref:piggyBac transposable element-derived protein 4-like n=1 Tax=Pecten maximus TaxID=6579 RepID=UPI001457FD20|nr:piggyBac transposable element-derived protein 4-like [Pecten maximus]
MAGNFTIGQVLPEFQELFDEIFDDEDSDEFDGFDIDDENNDGDLLGSFAEDTWIEGGKTPMGFTFTGNAGPKNLPEPETGSLSILDYFEAVFTDGHPERTQHSRFKKWTPVTHGEMKVFIAVAIAMGIIKQINMQDYWCTDPVVSTPFFSSVMPRDRFLSIMSFLHLSNNTLAVPRGEEGYTHLQKVGSLYQELLQRFQEVYNPSQCVAVDEGMIAWRGNLKFRVYSPDKPIKYGNKALHAL